MDTPTTEPYAFENLGGQRRVPNPKEYKIGSATAPVYNFPATKAKPANRTYYFQGQRPACGAHAGVSFMDSMLMQKAGLPLQNNNPRDLWVAIKKDGSDPSAGTTMDRVFAALGSTGVVPYEPLENNVTFDDLDYANTDALTPAVLAEEGKQKLLSHAYLTDMSMNGIKQAINDFGAVIILIDVCARFWTAADGTISWAAADIIPLGTPSAQFPVIDGHFMVADYYDETGVYGPNSFGETWGLNGDFSFQADYLPWVIEAAVGRVSVPVVAPTPEVVAQVAQQMPAVTAMVQHIDSLPQEVKDAHPDWFAQAQSILANMAHALTGKP